MKKRVRAPTPTLDCDDEDMSEASVHPNQSDNNNNNNNKDEINESISAPNVDVPKDAEHIMSIDELMAKIYYKEDNWSIRIIDCTILNKIKNDRLSKVMNTIVNRIYGDWMLDEMLTIQMMFEDKTGNVKRVNLPFLRKETCVQFQILLYHYCYGRNRGEFDKTKEIEVWNELVRRAIIIKATSYLYERISF
jgi:hypothetical protein